MAQYRAAVAASVEVTPASTRRPIQIVFERSSLCLSPSEATQLALQLADAVTALRNNETPCD